MDTRVDVVQINVINAIPTLPIGRDGDQTDVNIRSDSTPLRQHAGDGPLKSGENMLAVYYRKLSWGTRTYVVFVNPGEVIFRETALYWRVRSINAAPT